MPEQDENHDHPCSGYFLTDEILPCTYLRNPITYLK